ncbi:hypothetical protein DR92_4697 (plasmid) [Brucella anthropi]|nr:hypothetical protein DR92_4697 [Brucella anthropi]
MFLTAKLLRENSVGIVSTERNKLVARLGCYFPVGSRIKRVLITAFRRRSLPFHDDSYDAK